MVTEMCTEKTFSEGDVVTWESVSYRVRSRKTGEVVFVVPPGRDFRFYQRELQRTMPLVVKTEGFSRRMLETYGVLVRRENRPALLYWPRTSQLELVQRSAHA